MQNGFIKRRFKYEGDIYGKGNFGNISLFYDTGAAYTTVRYEDLRQYLRRDIDLTNYVDVIIVGYVGKNNHKVGKLVCLSNVTIMGIIVPRFFVTVVDNDVNGNLLGCDFISACDSNINKRGVTISNFDESIYMENIKDLLDANGKLDLYFNGYLDSCCLNPPEEAPTSSDSSLSRLLRMAENNK